MACGEVLCGLRSAGGQVHSVQPVQARSCCVRLGAVAPEAESCGMSLPIVVSFYTVNTAYEVMASRLRTSCERLGLAHDMVGIDSRGTWDLDTATKATVCRDAWRRLGRPILWVDADAVIHARPELLRDAPEDVAVHKWKGQHFASGTVFFNQTPLAGRLLDGWVDRCAAGDSDQIHLELAWKDIPEIRTLWLPRSYCQIFDARRDEPAVIEHFQASRVHRVKVKS